MLLLVLPAHADLPVAPLKIDFEAAKCIPINNHMLLASIFEIYENYSRGYRDSAVSSLPRDSIVGGESSNPVLGSDRTQSSRNDLSSHESRSSSPLARTKQRCHGSLVNNASYKINSGNSFLLSFAFQIDGDKVCP